MPQFSPMTLKRLRSFRRLRRAWWSLLAFVAIFVFCLAAELVCPCDPKAVVDVKTLEPWRARTVERLHDVRTARFSVDAAGTLYDFEGPDDPALAADCRAFAAACAGGASGEPPAVAGYRPRVTRAADHVRVYLEPDSPPAVVERELPPKPVAFPFPPCPGHPFGIDAGGRDVYARVVHGLRIALLFGLLLACSGLVFGVVVGAIQGFFGGVIDIVGQRLTEIWSALPFLYVMIFIGSTMGRGFGVLLACYALFNWITVSYYMRGEFLRLRTRTFVDAARVQGFSSLRIIFTQILPNALTPLITLFPFLLMGAIGSLAALDFLGFGLPPMTPSCGELLAEAQQFRWAWWLVLFPALALFVVMLLAVLIGEGLRDAFDPRQEARYA